MRFTLFCLLSLYCICGFGQDLPKSAWKITSVDSEERNEDVPGSGPASCIIDNDKHTFWTVGYKTQRTPFPHYVIIDLGAIAGIKGFVFYPRQERYQGKISDYSIFASSDNRQWTLVHKGRFIYKSIYDGSAKLVRLNHLVNARFIKFQAESELSKQAKSMHLAEMDIQGTYLTPVFAPKIHINKTTVLKNEGVSFTDSSFVENTTIRSWEWNFPGGNPSKSYEQNPKISYKTCGTYDVSLTVTSKEGVQKKISLPKAIICLPAPSVARSGWTLSVSEQEVILAHDSAGNMMDNKNKTIWHTAYLSDKKLPHIIQIDLGKSTEIRGIGYQPRSEGGINGIFKSYRVFVSDDTLSFGQAIYNVNESKPYSNIRISEFPATKGRFVRIIIDKTFPEGSNFASCSELYIYGNENNYSNFIWIITGFILTIFAGVLYIRQTKKKKNTSSGTPPAVSQSPYTRKVGIYLFGKVQIVNEGRDVEQLFNKLKQILALITYHTIESEGISTVELSRQLWSELPDENVASARGTNIKKLRTALQDIPALEIITEKKTWRILFDNKLVYIDFLRYRELFITLSEAVKTNQFNEKLIEDYLSIIERGRFLEDIETEWADTLKNRISEEIIDILKLILNNFTKKLSKRMKIRLSDALFLQDELNVDAFKLRLQLYYEDSNMGLAKKTYDAYCRKYKLLYNEEFGIKFNDLFN